MVGRILQTLTAPVRGLHQAAYLLALLTLASQILAIVRDRLFAHQFGAGQILDLYYSAFKIPDVVFALIASLVSAYVLVPRMVSRDKAEVRELLSQAASFLLIAGGLVCLILFVWAPTILFLLFPTFKFSAYAGEFVFLARILLLQPLLLGLSGIFGSYTQLEKRFVLFAISPVLYNLGIIFGTVALYPRFGLAGIGYGVVFGAALHFLVNVWVVIEARTLPRFVIPAPRVILSLVRQSVPRSLALSMGSIIGLLLTSLASRVSEGAVSIYTLAANIEAVPLSLIGASYATAAFPVLSEAHHRNDREGFKTMLSAAGRQIIFWTSVITVLTIVLRAYIVRILYGSGAFDWDDTRLTAAVLAILIVSLLAQCIILLAARAFYASGKSWNPLFVQIADFGVSVAFAWGLLQYAQTHPMIRYFFESMFRVSDVPGTNVLFIALGATIGQILMAIVALLTLNSVASGVARSLVRPMLEGFGAAILGGAAAYGVLILGGTIAPLTSLTTVFLDGFISGMVGLIVSALVLLLLENQEFRNILDSLKRISSKSLSDTSLVQEVD